MAFQVPEGKHSVFVYGTLKRGFFNHYVMEGMDTAGSSDRVRQPAVFVADAQTSESFQLVIGGRYQVPFLLDASAKGCCILGEVYLVDEATLARLDLLEGVPHYYQRQLTRVQLSGSEEGPKEAECLLYLQQTPSEELLALPSIGNYTLEHHSRCHMSTCQEADRMCVSYVRPSDRDSYSDVPGAK